MALRLSTVGSDVLEGTGLGISDGRGVSVNVSVCNTETVSVGARDVIVLVTGENGVFVNIFVSITVGGTEVDIKLQENEVMINKMGKIAFRFII